MSVSLIDGHIDREKQTMTDNEIIQSLSDLVKSTEIIKHCGTKKVIVGAELLKDILNLIKRKDEQIEALIAGQETLQKALNEKIAEVERLNKELLKSKIFKFARNPRRIYNVMDLQDGEILRFYDYPDKPSAVSQGYYFFQGKEDIRLININEVKELSCNEIKSEAVKEFAERFLKKIHENHYLLSDKHNSTDKGMFTIGIEQAVKETEKEMEK